MAIVAEAAAPAEVPENQAEEIWIGVFSHRYPFDRGKPVTPSTAVVRPTLGVFLTFDRGKTFGDGSMTGEGSGCSVLGDSSCTSTSRDRGELLPTPLFTPKECVHT